MHLQNMRYWAPRQAHLQQSLDGSQIRLAMQAVLFPVPVLLQSSSLNLPQQGSGHVGVLVYGLLPLCQLW